MGTNGSRARRGHPLTVVALGRAIEIEVNRTGLTASRFRALSLVGAGVTSSGVLARFLAVRPPTVTTVMNGLVDDGLVVRARGIEDRRRVDYRLTGEGRRALDTANKAADGVLGSLVADLPADDRTTAQDGLDVWRRALDAKRADR